MFPQGEGLPLLCWQLGREQETYRNASADSYVSHICSTLLVGKTGLEQAKKLLISYKTGETREMTPQLWKAKKIVDSTLHPGTARPHAVFGVQLVTYTNCDAQTLASRSSYRSACPVSCYPTWSSQPAC